MAINLTNPANHPANGLLAVERIIRVRDELQRTMFYANGGVMDYIVVDAIKGLEELLMSRGLSSKPYGYVHKAIYEQSGSCGLSNDHETYADSDTHIALYTAPPSPQSSKMSGIMPDYEGVAMTQRECYMAGKEAGLAEARKSPVIPDGYVLVPVEPTLGMLDEFDSIIDYGAEDSKDAWRRLLTAAPQEVK